MRAEAGWAEGTAVGGTHRKEAPEAGADEAKSSQSKAAVRGKVSFHPSVFLAMPYREKVIL